MTNEAKDIPLHLHPLGFIECFVRLGADLDELLENTDINRPMITSGEARISYRQQDALIENGLRLCPCSNLGLRVGAMMDWNYHGSVGSVVFSSTNLKDAWNLFFRFLCRAQPACSRRVFERSFYVNDKRQIVEPIIGFSTQTKHPDIARFELEFMLAIGLRLCDLCGDKSIEDNKVGVSLAWPKPDDLSAFQRLPCDEILFEQTQTAIYAHVDFVNDTWRPFRKHAFEKLLRQCEAEQNHSAEPISICSRARWHIGTNYFDKQLSLEDIADKLHMTPRTLTRKLAKENTSFRAIFYEVRMELTVYHLQNSDLSLDAIASLMRFSSVASLRRAVKNYSGDTLATLRHSELEQHAIVTPTSKDDDDQDAKLLSVPEKTAWRNLA